MYIAMCYVQTMVAKCLSRSVLSWGTLCLVINIYIQYIYIQYIYTHSILSTHIDIKIYLFKYPIYIAIYYVQKMVAKCLNRSVLSWGTLCLVIINIYIYKYIYIYVLYILYLYLHLCVCMSVCLQLSLRPTFWMDAAGFEPAGGGGVQVRDERSFPTRGPRNQFGMKNHASCIQSPGNTLLKKIELQLAS